MKQKIVYFGTPNFSADLLEKLVASDLVEVTLVVTQPDKPVGRNQNLTPSSVKLTAQKYTIPVYDKPNLDELPKILKEKEIDFGLLYSFGFKQWLTADLLASPKIKFGDTGFGFLNIHPSLLPKYRGASPIVFPLLLGDKETGVSLIVIDEKMDHGPLLAQEKLTIEGNDTTHTLTTKLTSLAFDMLDSFVRDLKIKNFKLKICEQEHARASFARFLTREDGFISLKLLQKALRGEPISLEEFPKIIKWYCQKNNIPLSFLSPVSQSLIPNMFRSLSPWPGLWTTVTINSQSKRLIIKDVTISTRGRSASGGNNQQLAIKTVQLEGKNEVDFKTFNKAYKLLK